MLAYSINKSMKNAAYALLGGIIAILTTQTSVLAGVRVPPLPPENIGQLVLFGSSDTEKEQAQALEALKKETEALRDENKKLRDEFEQLRKNHDDLKRQVESGRSGPSAEGKPISGRIDRIVDTGTLMISGQRVRLYGVQGVSNRRHVDLLSGFIRNEGGQLNCEPKGEAHICRTQKGNDLSAVVLANGGARVATDSTDDYRRFEAEAKRKRIGIWQG